MTQSISTDAWNLFVEARKEILENQKIRTQVIGFKITFVSAGIGLIAANSEKISPTLLVVPAFAAIFFDFLITSYSFAIKRTGFYCWTQIEPIIRESSNWPEKYYLWEEFMRQPQAKQRLAFSGNIGITILAIAPAIYVLLLHPSPLTTWASWLLILLLLSLLVYDLVAYRLPKRRFSGGEAKKRGS